MCLLLLVLMLLLLLGFVSSVFIWFINVIDLGFMFGIDEVMRLMIDDICVLDSEWLFCSFRIIEVEGVVLLWINIDVLGVVRWMWVLVIVLIFSIDFVSLFLCVWCRCLFLMVWLMFIGNWLRIV